MEVDCFGPIGSQNYSDPSGYVTETLTPTGELTYYVSEDGVYYYVQEH
jgi:hypothetical protein